MNTELVFKGENGQALTTSLLVAEKFGKNHRDVLDAIRDLVKGSAEFSAHPMFEETTYIHPQNGQTYPMFVMNRDGFSLLAMGFTGKKALEFKLGFIAAFNQMENAIRSGGFSVPQSFSEALQLAANQAKRIEAQRKEIEQRDKTITKLQPKADFADAAFATDSKVDIGMTAKILKLSFGRNTLFKKLKEKGILFGSRNEPKQKYVDAGYFELTEKFIERNEHPGFVVTKVLVTQKGLSYINSIFNGKRSDGKLLAMK